MVLSPLKSRKPPTSKQSATASSSSSNQLGTLRLQKGPKPLLGKRFFFDIRNHSIASRLEASIKSYGGVVIPFLAEDIDCVITERTEWGGPLQSPAGSPLCGTPKPSPSPSLPHLFSPAASPAGNSRGSNFSPSTLDSPSESYGGGRRYSKSRAEAMLERVRSQPQFRTRDPLVDAQNWGLLIWSVENILRLLHKISQSHKKPGDSKIVSCKREPKSVIDKVRSRTGKFFIKIESTDRKYKPSYKDLPCWPAINLNSDPGTSPFLLKPVSTCVAPQPKVEAKLRKETNCVKPGTSSVQPKGQKSLLRRSPRKKHCPLKQHSPSKGNVTTVNLPRKCSTFVFQDKESVNLVPPRPPSKRHPERALFPETKKECQENDPLPGYCEICKVDYQDLRKHCQTDSHRQYSTNNSNYALLDQRIASQSLNLEAYFNSLFCENTRNSRPEEVELSCSSLNNVASEENNMRQPVDERHASSKMVGRKETMEMQCNGISNHVQTRFTCTKGDRENLGGIFLDERLTAAQLRKRRSISVSCKDLLEIAPASERTHYLRSGRPARSELSQLSPALSDNSHPLLNCNSHQPLLSPTLSERGHNLRTRSQIWSNGVEDDSLHVTTNHNVEKCKPEKIEKLEKSDKAEKSTPADNNSILNAEEMKEKERESRDRDLRTSRNHNRNRSMRRKRLSAEEKLIEDNRGYYKVEVLNSKLRSTGLFVQQLNQGESTVNGACTSNGPGRSGSHEEKEPVVVRFKKVRRSELSVLSDEAENFMFGEQRSESNTENSSESDEDDEEEEDLDEEEDVGEDDDDDEGGGTDSNGINENGTDSGRSRSSQRNGRRSESSSRRGREQSHRIKIKLCNDVHSRCTPGDIGSSSQTLSCELNGTRRYRKRRTQAEAFITDNLDYYKFELAGSRLRVHGSPTSPSEAVDTAPNVKSSILNVEDAVVNEVLDGTPCPIDDLHFSFESVPRSEVWFQTFQRQDRGEELFFPSVGDPSTVILPYQLPRPSNSCGQRSLGRRRSKNSLRLPRKSPRCHASTLAILSSVVKRRCSKEPDKVGAGDAAPEIGVDVEPKSTASKLSQSSSSATETSVVIKDECLSGEEEIQEIAKSIDSMLGFVPGSSSDTDKDPDACQIKSSGKGRGRKKQASKTVTPNVTSAPETVPDNDRDKDPSLNYLIDPAILEELACTCDVVSDPRGGPTMDILSLLSSYSDCCCIVEESSNELGIDASCNSSECGASSTCDAERRMRKKRKRRNLTGWDKPKRKCILRRDALNSVPEEDTATHDSSSKDSIVESEPILSSADSNLSVHRVPNSISSSPAFQRKCGSKRKLRSSLSLSDSPRKGIAGQPRLNVMKIEKDSEVPVPVNKGKSRKLRRIGWSKAR